MSVSFVAAVCSAATVLHKKTDKCLNLHGFDTVNQRTAGFFATDKFCLEQLF